MNITHAISEEVKGDKLLAIFSRQKELMDKYHHIEERSGLLQTKDYPINLDDKRGQARIKDFAWRVTEELGEAIDALDKGELEHFTEELIDGLHFLTELTLNTGYTPKDIWGPVEGDYLEYLCDKNLESLANLNKLIRNFIKNIGMMCNCLKNKPWKQTNMLTDRSNFLRMLLLTWDSYISILSTTLKPEDIIDIYLKKSQVNKFRQRSNY